MKRVIFASAVMAAVLPGGASFSDTPEQASVWVGLSGSLDGFLLDEDTGAIWMTGPCLKALPIAEKRAGTWVSTSREMASVGRLSALVDQTFHVGTTIETPSIAIDNPARGGLQRLDGVERLVCERDACDGLKAITACAG